MTNGRIYIRAVGDRGKPFRKLDGGFDGDLSIGFWSKDGKTIYFNEGIRATQQLFAIDCEQNEFRQITQRAGVAQREPGRQDRQDPDQLLGRRDAADDLRGAVDRAGRATRPSWMQLTDANPQVRGFALGEQEEITWTSTDGTKVGGVLVKPVGYQAGTALSADRRDPRRPGVGRHPQLQRRLRLAGLRRRRLHGAPPELPRLDQLRRQAQDRHRRQLLPEGLRGHHDRRRPPDRAGHGRRQRRWARSAGAPAATGRTGS